MIRRTTPQALSLLSLIVLSVMLCLWTVGCKPTETAEPDEPCLLKTKTSISSSYTTATSYSYNSNNQVISEMTSATGLSGPILGYPYPQYVWFKYDSLGFLILKTLSNTTDNTIYRYENGRLIFQSRSANSVTLQKYAYDSQGKIARYEYNRPSPNQQFSYWYDFKDGILIKASGKSTVENGRLADEYETTSFWNEQPTNFRRYSYDEKSRTIKEEFIDGKTKVANPTNGYAR